MKWLTQDAVLRCDHVLGIVQLVHSQQWVTIENRAVLVAIDPEGRSIAGCPNAAPPMYPCLITLVVREGYSDLLRIDGRAICLDTVTGKTNGNPPGVVDYTVASPGQIIVTENGD
jgi:hypothetical protein